MSIILYPVSPKPGAPFGAVLAAEGDSFEFVTLPGFLFVSYKTQCSVAAVFFSNTQAGLNPVYAKVPLAVPFPV